MLADIPDGDLPTPPAPTLQVRRPQGRVVTQTIERAATTYTTHVTLGLGPNATPIPEATGTSNGDGGSATTAPPPAAPPAGTVNSSPGYNYIGAIVGSVVAFVFLILLLWFCLFRPRILRRQQAVYDYSSGYDSASSSSRSRSPPRRQRPRGPPPPVLNPPPVRIKPTRHTGWTHSAEPQIRGVRVFP